MPVITQTQLQIFLTAQSAPLTIEQILGKLIEEDKASPEKAEMQAGEDYFACKNDILKKDFRKWKDSDTGEQFTQDDKANNTIPHAFYRLQALEKAAYLLKNPITITFGENLKTETEKVSAEIIRDKFVNILGSDFNDIISDWAIGAGNKGREWLHVFFDGADFSYMVMDAREIIPVYDTSREQKLESLIRYYTVVVNTSGEEKKQIRVEWYYPDRVDVYQQKDGVFKFEGSNPHFTTTNTANEMTDGGSWGEVPFIELVNNSKRISDLRPLKDKIDAYDLIDSEFANDLEDIQEAIIKAIGVGDDPSKIRANIRKFKVFQTNNPREETDLDFLSQDIPHAAKTAWMEKAEKNIASEGMSLDHNADKFGQNPSGVALKFMYLPLDLKASLLEKKLNVALYALFGFVNKYFEIVNEKPIEDISEFKFTFNKNMIANEKEQVELATGRISERTRLENHPWVDNVDDELNRIADEPPIDSADDIGKIPLAIQQLALAKQRAIDTGQESDAALLGEKINGLLSKISTNGK